MQTASTKAFKRRRGLIAIAAALGAGLALFGAVPSALAAGGSSAKVYKVRFLPNGGRGSARWQTIRCNKATPLAKNQFSRKGYKFKGWAKKSGGAVAYKNGAKVRNLAKKGGTATLYAKWAATRYNVVFKANGGSGKMGAQKMTYDKAAKLRANAFKRSGYTFQGWAKSPGGKVVFKNKKAVKNLTANGKSVVLYAKWKAKPKGKYITVKFYANGGTGKMADQKLLVKRGYYPKISKNAFTRSGYVFDKWYFPQSITTLIPKYYPDQYELEVDTATVYEYGVRTIKVYAQWKKKGSLAGSSSATGTRIPVPIPTVYGWDYQKIRIEFTGQVGVKYWLYRSTAASSYPSKGAKSIGSWTDTSSKYHSYEDTSVAHGTLYYYWVCPESDGLILFNPVQCGSATAP